MISLLSNFFAWIVDILESLWSYATGLIRGLLTVVRALPQVVTLTTSTIGHLPSVLLIFAYVTVAVCVTYTVLGRNTGGD